MRYDENMYINGEKDPGGAVETLEFEIRNLCESQPFAVLATQGKGQPYSSLIGYAFSQDMKYIVFSTPRQTRKFALMEESSHVSFLIDNRSNQPANIDKISALTITAQVDIPTKDEDIKKWSELLLKRHPYLETFVQSEGTAIVVAKVFRYFFVQRFQEVLEWIPE